MYSKDIRHTVGNNNLNLNMGTGIVYIEVYASETNLHVRLADGDIKSNNKTKLDKIWTRLE